ncbi:hypothetical protein CRG98_016811 [Punica granatum]|uniref:Uncharacterized protein n=1 Tax=Punica granatum TaxID=22663 RepID=A0A2I0K3V5_PUNGR|nr:hypothetical protein CRG98_016811 [Punica granatum]
MTIRRSFEPRTSNTRSIKTRTLSRTSSQTRGAHGSAMTSPIPCHCRPFPWHLLHIGSISDPFRRTTTPIPSGGLCGLTRLLWEKTTTTVTYRSPLATQGRRLFLRIPSVASVATFDPTCASRVCPVFQPSLFGAIRVCSTENSPYPTHQWSNPTLEGPIPHLGTRYDYFRLRGARTFTLLLCLWSFKRF